MAPGLPRLITTNHIERGRTRSMAPLVQMAPIIRLPRSYFSNYLAVIDTNMPVISAML